LFSPTALTNDEANGSPEENMIQENSL